MTRSPISLRRLLRGTVAVTTVLAHLLQVQPALAQQIVPNAAAPATNRPTIGASSGGRPTIDIVTPNAGVSVNKYSTFNVGPNGVIINNSTADTTTKAGGTVKANKNLVGKAPANVVVNEVAGTAASSIAGNVELVGTTADVIIANQNGVTCDGCSTTGIRSTTLTTGGVSVDGSKVQISVFGGVASVGRAGMSSDGSVNLSARHVLVDGPMSIIGDLGLFGGTHALDPATATATAKPVVSARTLPYAVDASAFGAMTAGSIRIIGNEAGLGVRTIGPLKAKKGIDLRSNGDLFYKDADAGGDFAASGTGSVNQYGTVTAKGTAKVAGRDVFIPGGRSLTGEAGASVSAIQQATIGGEVVGASVAVSAGTDVTNTGFLVGDVAVTVSATGNITNTREKFTVYDGQAWADAWLKSYRDLFQQWTQSTDPTRVYWGNEYFKWSTTAIVDEYLLAGGTILGGDVTIRAGLDVSNVAGQIAATRDVAITAGRDFVNASKATTNRVTVADGCTATGANCGTRTNFHPGEVLAGRNLSITAGRDLTNTASTLAAWGDVALAAGGTIRNYALSTNFITKEFETVADTTKVTQDGYFWAPYTLTTHSVETVASSNTEVDYTPAVIRALTGSSTLTAGGDILVLGSTIASAGTTKLDAKGGIRLSDQAGVSTSVKTDTLATTTTSTYDNPYCRGCSAFALYGLSSRVNAATGSSSSAAFGVGIDGTSTSVSVSTVHELETSPALIIGNDVVLNARDVVSTGARIFAQRDLSIAAQGRIALDAAADTYKLDTGELKSVLPDTATLLDTIHAAKGADYASWRAYLVADPLVESLSTLHSATGGRQISAAAHKVGTSIDLSTFKTTDTTWSEILVPVTYNWWGWSWTYWMSQWVPITTTTEHAKLTPTTGYDTLSQAIATERPQRGTVDDAVAAAVAYDWSAKSASMSLDQTTRGILQAGRDLTLVSGNDTILTGGTIANAKRNVRVDAGRDFVMLALRDTGLADGNDLLARQADFHAGFLSTGPTTSVAISGTSPTALVAGGDMTIAAKRNVLNYGGSAVSSGSMIVAAGQDVLNDAVRSFYTLTAADGCANWACGMLGHRYKSGEFLAGSGLVVSAGRDIVNTGSQMAGAGSVLLTAARDVRNEALSSQFLIDYLERRNYIHILWWDIYVGSTIINKYQGIVQESNVVSEFGSVSAQAGRDLINIGSVWSAGGAIDLAAKNDARFDTKTEEMQNVYKSSGFYAFGYSSNKQYWNGFVNAFSDIEGASVSIAAGNDLRGIGVKLVSGGDTVLSAGRDATFDALQNAYYVRASGWSIGFVAPAFSIVAAALRGDGKAALQSYVSQNPLLAAVHNLATGNGGSLGNSLKLVTGGASLLASANYAARSPDSLGLTGSLAAQFSPLLGNALDPFALWKDGASSLTNAAKNCVTSPLSCSFLSGIALRFSTWKSEQEWTETTVSRLLVGQDLTVSAGRDIALVGGTVASVARDATLVAGRNIGLAAVADTNRSRSSSWGLTLGFQPNGVRIGADASASNANATVFSNASLVAGRDVTMVAGQDLSLIGANVSGANVTLDAGRDLLLISQQNQSTSNSWSFDVSVTLGASPETGAIGVTGFSLAGAFSNGARTYTDTPTTVIAGDRLDAYVGRTTVLAGAGMWSKTGKLKLDTNDLVFDNYSNKDTYVAVSGGISYDSNSNHPWDGNFSTQYRNTKGLTFATLGAGDINVRARPKLDLSGLNRDTANMTRVTSSTSWSFTIPALNLAKLADELTAAYHFVNTLTARVPEDIQIRGEQAVKQYQALLLRGASADEARRLMTTTPFLEALKTRNRYDRAMANGGGPEAASLALAVVKGEDAYWDAERGVYVFDIPGCNAQMGTTPCQVLVTAGKLKAAYTADDVRAFFDTAFQAINKDNPTPQEVTEAALALRCVQQIALRNRDGTLDAVVATYGGAEKFYDTAAKIGVNPTSLVITQAVSAAIRSNDPAQINAVADFLQGMRGQLNADRSVNTNDLATLGYVIRDLREGAILAGMGKNAGDVISIANATILIDGQMRDNVAPGLSRAIAGFGTAAEAAYLAGALAPLLRSLPALASDFQAVTRALIRDESGGGPVNVFTDVIELFTKSNPRSTLAIEGRVVAVGAGGNRRGTTIILDSQNLTDAEIRLYAERLAGGPLAVPASNPAGVWTATTTDATTVTLRSVSSSTAQTGARWTIEINRNSSVALATGNSKIELKFR